MRRLHRIPAPSFLTNRWQDWGERYAQNKTTNPSHVFQWATHQQQKVNQRLLPSLIAQTQNHCSYCDYAPPRFGDDTIDHFRPKGNPRFYRLAYQWENLYFCCNHCQRVKMEQFDDRLLCPDEMQYRFERYFLLDTRTFEIQPNLAATPDEQQRAMITIEIFGFNHEGQKAHRKMTWKLYHDSKDLSPDERDDLAFRFMFE